MTAYYKTCIENELGRRIKKNPNYSLRAFARATQIDVSMLSKILSGKMVPSKKTTLKLLEHISLNNSEYIKFKTSVDANRGIVETSKNISEDPTIQLEEESMDVLSSWHHIAILELTETKNFKLDFKWIASQFNISEMEVKMSIEKLKRLGLVKEESNTLIRTKGMIRTKDKGRTSASHKQRQSEVLEKSLESLRETPIFERSHTTMTMSIDESRLEEAKQLILEFNKKMCNLLEAGEKTRVYEMSIGLFPLQLKDKRYHAPTQK